MKRAGSIRRPPPATVMLESERQYSPPEPPSIGRMACLIPGFLIAVAIAVGATFGVVSCLRASPATSYSTRIDALPEQTPVFLSDPGIYLVRLPDGVIALDHHELRWEDAIEGCLIRWRETLEAAGRRGLFRSDCTGTLYGLDGTPVEGNSLPMKRHPVKRDGDRITVDFNTCISPGEGNAEVRCRPI